MNNTANTNDLKMNIISLLTKINDINKLKIIYKQTEELEEMSAGKQISDVNLEHSMVEISDTICLEELFKEQNYQPTDFREFRKLADQIEWSHSVEELLENLD